MPILTLGDDLARLTLNGGKYSVDPVAEATRMGNVPTLGDVKKSVKVRKASLGFLTGLIIAHRH